MEKLEYKIDGNAFHKLEEFFDVIGQTLIPGAYWGRNLNAFNDILRGGFGTPDGGFVFRWVNSAQSRERLGSELFESLVRIIRIHGSGGEEEADGVLLILD